MATDPHDGVCDGQGCGIAEPAAFFCGGYADKQQMPAVDDVGDNFFHALRIAGAWRRRTAK